MKVIKGISHSHVAARLLKIQTNKSVVMPAPTRWSYLALTYSRCVEIFDEINAVSIGQSWGPLSSNDRDLMQNVLKLIAPFKEITTMLQASKRSTLSLVFPAITHLIRSFEVIFKFSRLISNLFLDNGWR